MNVFERMLRAESIRYIRREMAKLDLVLSYDELLGGFYLSTQDLISLEEIVDPSNLDTEEISTVVDIIESYRDNVTAVAI